MFGRRLAWAMLGVVVACSKAPEPDQPVRASSSAPQPAPTAEKHDAKTDEPAPEPLSEEDIALIEADPKTLTPEQRRKRAYALRRKIMQDPDSPAARTLLDLQKAHQAGELELPSKTSGPTLSLPGTQPSNARPPAGARGEPDESTP